MNIAEWLEKNPKVQQFASRGLGDLRKFGKRMSKMSTPRTRAVQGAVEGFVGGFGSGMGERGDEIWRGTKRSFTSGKINRAAGLVSRHPGAFVGGAALVGLMASNPFGGAYEQIVNQGILGQPHATRTIASAGALVGIQNAFSSDRQRMIVQGGYTRQFGETQYQPPGGGSYNESFPVQNPLSFVGRNMTPASGNIVLGMWNLRHSGTGF